MKCVILAGGEGLRFWPLSRKKYPKQFLKIDGSDTMFQETVLRNKIFSDSFMVLTNDEFRFIVDNQIDQLGILNYETVLETVGRNTAPAITIAAMLSNPEEVIFVVPADAQIDAGESYMNAINEAKNLAEEGFIVTFGIVPRSPHTGYGYIKCNGNIVDKFKEKPDVETAKSYVEQGGYFWNSGMFMFKAGVFLEEISKYRSDISEGCMLLCDSISKGDTIILPKEKMLAIPSESVDFAVMEKSEKIRMVKSEFSWNDVGGLEALCSTFPEDGSKNGFIGRDVIINESENVKVINDTKDQLVIVNDMADAVVVNTYDAIYISKVGSSAAIKEIIKENTEKFGEYFSSTIKNYRPWGYYEVLTNDKGYKVKKITIYSHRRLSLQKHFYRSEHWTVVDGQATITLGKKTAVYKPNESAYIPIGELHRVANDTESEVSIIEVSIGERIDEDDIVRIQDDFGR